MRLAVLYLLDSEMAINDIGIKLGYDYKAISAQPLIENMA